MLYEYIDQSKRKISKLLFVHPLGPSFPSFGGGEEYACVHPLPTNQGKRYPSLVVRSSLRFFFFLGFDVYQSEREFSSFVSFIC